MSHRTLPAATMLTVSSPTTVKNPRTQLVKHLKIVELLNDGLFEGMPVLEDGLSDSECISGDECPSPAKSKLNGRHQSTQSDFLFDPNHSALVTSSHKRQFAKSMATNGPESQSASFYIRPPPPSSFVRPVNTRSATSTNESQESQQKPSTEESSTQPAGK